jgi:hypothetical protein
MAQEPRVLEEDDRHLLGCAHLQVDHQALDRKLTHVGRRGSLGMGLAQDPQILPNLGGEDLNCPDTGGIKRPEGQRLGRRPCALSGVDGFFLHDVVDGKPKVVENAEQSAGGQGE